LFSNGHFWKTFERRNSGAILLLEENWTFGEEVLAKFILGGLVVHYLNNDAARSAFVRAHASTDLVNALIEQYVDFAFTCRFSHWFARIASHANPSDEPSRLNFGTPWLRNAQQISLVLPAHLSEWGLIGCAAS
jgi:hypothetical protein